jgi:pyrimidine-nucleoside phosphorylase
MPDSAHSPLHTVDLIRKKRDGGTLDAREIGFLVAGAASGSIPLEQLAAWLMAAWLQGLSLEETRALTLAMRDSGEKFSPTGLGKKAVDKHSTGGVGDKTSFLIAPIAAACGVAVPMISGRALGHTGGTLDKLESIPGFRTALSLKEFEAVLLECGASIVSQTPRLVPADRILYELRDRTATVESPGLICASILSKKLAAGLDALVLDVKTGSGAFLRDRKDSEFLAALMVATAEGAGTRTVALLTDMSQPLGAAAGNWIELIEALELLRGKRSPESEDLLELSLILAGWMIHLGNQAGTPKEGYTRAQAALADGSALKHFFDMVKAQGGDISAFDDPLGFHNPGAVEVVPAWERGFVATMDTTALGWAVQRTGAGREKAGAPVDPDAGIVFHARRGAFVEKGQPVATVYATEEAMLPEPVDILKQAIRFTKTPPEPVDLVSRVFTRESAQEYLRDAVR